MRENKESYIGFGSSSKLKEFAEGYSKSQGISLATVCRKALIEFLKNHGGLINAEEYY